jgi:hypothetical protein
MTTVPIFYVWPENSVRHEPDLPYIRRVIRFLNHKLLLKVRTANCLSDLTRPNDGKIGTAVITQMIIWTLHE